MKTNGTKQKKSVVTLSEKFGLNCCNDTSFYADVVGEVIKAGDAFVRVSFDESVGGQYSKAITRCSL